ncbi:aspartate ammonia-lyase [Salipiger sp. PrR002]|uniref:aspartate ammonia-lyase n=1 Tax=Salipiger sp. PrR002 TaxID=2706489 RepID=UPI0013BDFD3B|nr:aspartate ammonia-lyase [Salipiger sp. PrR002]NDW00145.1 aspartate ammonia-lyase [Salipiger sp. PrR002]NDW56846.1 aspartate ammonia-lyase [Salipiger sp. PrR004]
MRTEFDSLGHYEVPDDALYGIHTMRAYDNFRISDVPVSEFPELVRSLAMVKKAAAAANHRLGVLSAEKTHAIDVACDALLAGEHHEHFIVDMMQGGAGTSTNMNANEVIANLGLRHMGHPPGSYAQLHPNDDVNKSQSTNDAYPTALRLAVLQRLEGLSVEHQRLCDAFAAKAEEFDAIPKLGRTQLQDAVPMTLGQEFRSFANTIEEDIERLRDVSDLLMEVNLGGTAIGTGVNAPLGYAAVAVEELRRVSGLPLRQARDLVEASSDLGGFVAFSGILKRVAVKLSKICNDLRLLSSGPRSGFGEIRLPAVQAGSSIMPGKVNPVIPEVVNQVAYQVIGNDLTVTMAAEAGQLQLNAMEPVAILNILQSIRILKRAMACLTDRCVVGIEADEARCRGLLENSLAVATSLVPQIGYESAARVAKHALNSGISVHEALRELGIEAEPLAS